MYCKNCGSLIDSDASAKYCSECGFAFSTSPGSNDNFVNHSINCNSSPISSTEYRTSQLKGHVQIIGIFELIIGAFLLLGSFVLIGVRSLVLNNAHHIEGASISEINVGMSVLLILGLFLALFSLFVLLSGIGLLKNKKWSRVTSMIVGALAISSFPLGTIFGAFSLYYLSRPEMSAVLVN